MFKLILNKKIYGLLLITLLLVLSCSKEQKKIRTKKSDIITLKYWCATNPNEIKLAKLLVSEWNNTHEKIKVELQPIPASRSSEEVLLAAIAGKTTPDICSNIWPGAMDDYTSSGGLVNFDRFPDFMNFINNRVPANILKFFKSPDGYYYQLPWKTNPTMIMYNKKMFREAGVKNPPRTYSEYIDAAMKVSKDLDGDGQNDQWMCYRDIMSIWWQRLFDFYPFYIAASGGKTLFNKDGQIIFNNKAAIQTFELFQKMYENGYFPIATMQGDYFIKGKLATQITSAWNIIHVEKFAPKGFDYDITPIPVPDDYKGKIYTRGDFKNISIFSTTKHPKEAWEFCKHLISRESDLKLLQICTQVPVRKNMITDSLFMPYFKKNPMVKKFAKQAKYTRGVDGISDLKEIFDCISVEYEKCALYGIKSPEKAVKDAADRARVIMEWNRGN